MNAAASRAPAQLGGGPGPRSLDLAARLRAVEAPGIGGFVAGRPPPVWLEARGSRVTDVDGRTYVDLTAGFGAAAAGHAHPAVVAAVRAQADRLLHGLGDVHPHEVRVRFAERLAALAPVPDARVYPAVSGADAVEIALKTAQLATGRAPVAAFTGGYHGLSYGALRATWRPAFRDPFRAALAPETLRLPYPDTDHPPFDAPHDGLAACLEEARRRLRGAAELGRAPGAVIVEPVQGREGVVVPPAGWLRGLAAIVREAGALLVADEVLTGLGRTGWLFDVEREGVVPDVLLVGKALGGGLPLAAAIAARPLFDVWDGGGEALHTATFLAHPLACAAALATLDAIESERLVERARGWEPRLRADLHALAAAHPPVARVRGVGMLWGVEIGGAGARPDGERARRVVEQCLERGVLLLCGGPSANVLELTPPLVLAGDEWAEASAVLDAALAASR
jgi:4-aminobutyrate aminotransferase-like enzyme